MGITRIALAAVLLAALSLPGWAGEAYYRGGDTDPAIQITSAERLLTGLGGDFAVSYSGTSIDFGPGSPSPSYAYGVLVLPNGTGHDAAVPLNIAQNCEEDDFSFTMQVTSASVSGSAYFGLLCDVDDNPDLVMVVWDDNGTPTALSWAGAPLDFDRASPPLPGNKAALGPLPWTFGIERVGDTVTAWYSDANSGRVDLNTMPAVGRDHRPRLVHDIGRLPADGQGPGSFSASVSEIHLTGGAGVLDVGQEQEPPPAPGVTSDTGSLVLQGTDATLMAPAGTTFQWLKDGVPITGETGQTLVLTMTTEADSGYYSVLVDGEEAPGVHIVVYEAGSLPAAGAFALALAAFALGGLGVARSRLRR